MATNFRVDVIDKYATGLFLRVMGDFDGSSAYRLTNLIHAEGKNPGNIIVDTDGLKEVHPFGLDIFKHNIKKKGLKIKFIGRFKSAFDY